jgi:hypothetical protein
MSTGLLQTGISSERTKSKAFMFKLNVSLHTLLFPAGTHSLLCVQAVGPAKLLRTIFNTSSILFALTDTPGPQATAQGLQ